ncbi:MAG: adenylate/guanylate cyclase domain-containing protein, partial [Pseudobdellovibrionaceae bacterium]|nr:adenylate/guanylate cyclase domain-containing protein [Pseudobdellovibrionaceae bacterium]
PCSMGQWKKRFIGRQMPLRSALLILLVLVGESAFADPLPYLSPYTRTRQSLLEKARVHPADEQESERLWRRIQKDDPEPEHRYLAAQALHGIFLGQGREKEGHQSCQATPPRADDYEAQATCLLFEPDLADSVITDRLEKIFLVSRQHFPGTIVPAQVMYRGSTHLIFSHDIPRAVSLLRQGLETLPFEARDMQVLLKKSMATIYITPSNSPAVIAEGLKLFDETEAYFQETGNWMNAENSAYNKAIALIMSIKDYEGALRELGKVQRDMTLVPDALVFRAYSLAKLGRHDEVIQVLQKVNLNNYLDEARAPFLKCYMHLARSMNQPVADLEHCLDLPHNTQTDVILHLTSEISQRPNPVSDELQLYRQFYWFYQHKIAPNMSMTLANTIDGLELQRARYESSLKDTQLDIQNRYSQLKTYALIGILVLLAGFVASWMRIFRQHGKIRRLNLYIQTQVLQRFLPPEIIKEILDGRNRLDESARTMSVTVLFADLCDFTRQSESLGPQRIALILNTFLIRMTEVIFEHGGTIDKFMGDGIMVIFGAPTELPDALQASKAVDCAVAMQKALMVLSQEWEAAGFPAFKMRIGIHQGHAVVGSFGGPKRSDFTVIGSTVNIGSRIERMAQPGDILISRDLALQLPKDQVISTGVHQIRGLDQAHELFVLKEMRWRATSA